MKTVERSRSKKKYCPKCALEGIQSPLHLFQLNEEESLLMCKNVDCTFMPTSNWESLVIKRDISSIPRSACRSSAGSVRSGHSSVQSAPPKLGLAKKSSEIQRGRLPHSTSLAFGQLSSTSSTAGFSVLNRHQLESPPPEVATSEKKSLVPIAPFLCGHAHTFSSFETNKIEDQRRQQAALKQISQGIFSGTSAYSQPSFSGIKRRASIAVSGLKRRGSSIESDSLSSDTSSDPLISRPTSPENSIQNSKKLRRILVPPETLAKIKDGTLKVKIVKTQAKSQPSLNQKTSEAKVTSSDSASKELTPSLSSKLAGSNPAGYNLQLTAVGPIAEVLKQQQSVGPVDNRSHLQQQDIQSHIDAINLHLEALNKALGTQNCPAYLDLSNGQGSSNLRELNLSELISFSPVQGAASGQSSVANSTPSPPSPTTPDEEFNLDLAIFGEQCSKTNNDVESFFH